MHVICTQTFCIFLLRNNVKRDNEQNDFIVNCLALEKNEDKRLVSVNKHIADTITLLYRNFKKTT